MGIDLSGCGRSKFSVKRWSAYTQEALAELVAVAVREHCEEGGRRGVVFVGHSMGCSLATLMATMYFDPSNAQGIEVLGIIAICPQAEPYFGKKRVLYTAALQIPDALFNILRAMDQRKGLHSASISQFAGKGSDDNLRLIQMRFNRQSRTPVFRRIAWGAIPRKLGSWTLNKGLPGLDVWASLRVPLFLVAGESDVVTPPQQIFKIAHALGKASAHSSSDSSKPAARSDQMKTLSETETIILDRQVKGYDQSASQHAQKAMVVKTCVLPTPAAHALFYDPANYRTLAGLIQTFLCDHVDPRLSLGWQLQLLSTEGKWDVKNLTKWQSITSVSDPVAGIFRAMKTLREVDGEHSPEKFVNRWKDKIRAVIDISHENPVYDPKALDEGGIEYYKLPTVSKTPPQAGEIQEFIKLVDRLRALPEPPPSSTDPSTLRDPTTDTQNSSTSPSNASQPQRSALIGVHCHYGFNRTGFFIACYLVEREGYSVQAAVDAFAAARPNGINHAHFLDQLFVRYCVGLKRAPTM